MDRGAILAKARDGDADAIATLITHSLRSKGITARATRHSYRLFIWLEAATLPNQTAAVDYIRQGMQRLQVSGIGTIQIHGQQTEQPEPGWVEEISLLEDFDPIGKVPDPLEPLAKPLPNDGPHLTPTDRTPVLAAVPSATPAFSQPASRPTMTTASRKKPLVIKATDFEPMKTAIILFVAVYGFLGAHNPSIDGPFIWLHYPDLAIHETGHLLFMPFGSFLHILGGSLTQILFPAVFTAYFFWSKQLFSSALTLFWTGQNFMDVGVYMRDAPYRLLPLTSDDPDAHDWYNLFNMMGCLDKAELIANLTHGIGVLLVIAAVIAGLYVARVDGLRSQTPSISQP
ncbi:MAG TPA: hypothetical protein V6D29_22465 [Leptolyngbyaceae cyanobacterium]